jgi:FkbM family methyltransferase
LEQDIVGRFLSRYGEWGWDEVGFVASVIPEGARVLDVGAFVGTFGLGLALRRKLDFLCFVEANPAVAPLLRRNVENNAIAPTVVVEAMVAEPGALPRAGYGEAGNVGSASFVCLEGARASDPPTRAITLADLRAEHGDFDLVKLDVEGMEYEILLADAAYLSAGDTTLWVECNEDHRSLEVAELMLSWGLDVHYFAFSAHNPNNKRNHPEPIFPLAYEAGLLVAPKSRPCISAELQNHRCIFRSVRTVDDLKNALWRTPRWGMPEWVNANAEELAALAGRALRGEAYETYLAPGKQAPHIPGKTVWEKLCAAEKGLITAERLARDRLNELSVERERREQVEGALRTAERLAHERLNELSVERERSDAAEAALASASALALSRLSEMGIERERAAAAEVAAKERAAVAEAAAKERAAAAETAANLRANAAEERARASETLLAAIHASIVWRLATPVHQFIGARPSLHAALRRARKAAAFVLGRRR